MRKYLRNQMRCAARATGVKPSKYVHFAWDEIQTRKVGLTARQINQARGTAVHLIEGGISMGRGASSSRGKYMKYYQDMAHTPSDPWSELANAVVAQAADDYRRLCNKKVKHGATMTDLEWNIVNGEISSIESFFRSDWGLLLSHGLASVILEKLEAEYADGLRTMLVKRERRLAESKNGGH